MTGPRVRTQLIGTFLPRDAADLERALDDVQPGRTCDLIELRLDALPNARERLDDWIARSPVPVVATCRRTNEGGRVDRTEATRLDLLAHAADCGAAWVDIEHDVHDGQIPGDARVLRSAHLDALPRDPTAFVERLMAAPADAGKLVIDRGSPQDVIDVLSLVRTHPGRLAAHVLSHPFSRAASATLGGVFTYGRLRRRAGFAFHLPGVEELRSCGVGRSRAGTQVFLLLGAAVDDSVSPVMLRRAFKAAAADCVSLPWSCTDPGAALDGIEAFDWVGAAVTIPFKRDVLLEVERRGGVVHPCAAQVGATNTVIRREGRWHAFNTDRGGLVDALRAPPSHDYEGRTALILGAGGAARAAVRSAQDLGARPLLWARRGAEARKLAQELAAADGPIQIAPSLAAALLEGPSVVIDATPAGPVGGEPLLDPSELPADAVVLDMVVAARPTALLAAAERAGREARSGLSMLAFQAARQLELLGLPPTDAGWLTKVGQSRLEASDRGVLLIGLRGAGKSTLGRALAARLEHPFVDTDARIEERTGRSPNEWLEVGEEAEFRVVEEQSLRALAAEPAAVVATGGGAPLHCDAFAELAARSFVVWLDAPDPVLLERTSAAPRAALTKLEPAAELQRLRGERDSVYRSAADLIVDSSSSDPDRLVDLIVDACM